MELINVLPQLPAAPRIVAPERTAAALGDLHAFLLLMEEEPTGAALPTTEAAPSRAAATGRSAESVQDLTVADPEVPLDASLEVADLGPGRGGRREEPTLSSNRPAQGPAAEPIPLEARVWALQMVPPWHATDVVTAPRGGVALAAAEVDSIATGSAELRDVPPRDTPAGLERPSPAVKAPIDAEFPTVMGDVGHADAAGPAKRLAGKGAWLSPVGPEIRAEIPAAGFVGFGGGEGVMLVAAALPAPSAPDLSRFLTEEEAPFEHLAAGEAAAAALIAPGELLPVSQTPIAANDIAPNDRVSAKQFGEDAEKPTDKPILTAPTFDSPVLSAKPPPPQVAEVSSRDPEAVAAPPAETASPSHKPKERPMTQGVMGPYPLSLLGGANEAESARPTVFAPKPLPLAALEANAKSAPEPVPISPLEPAPIPTSKLTLEPIPESQIDQRLLLRGAALALGGMRPPQAEGEAMAPTARRAAPSWPVSYLPEQSDSLPRQFTDSYKDLGTVAIAARLRPAGSMPAANAASLEVAIAARPHSADPDPLLPPELPAPKLNERVIESGVAFWAGPDEKKRATEAPQAGAVILEIREAGDPVAEPEPILPSLSPRVPPLPRSPAKENTTPEAAQVMPPRLPMITQSPEAEPDVGALSWPAPQGTAVSAVTLQGVSDFGPNGVERQRPEFSVEADRTIAAPEQRLQLATRPHPPAESGFRGAALWRDSGQASPLQQVAIAIRDGDPRGVELQLQPVELGAVRIFLRHDGEVMRVVVLAERGETLNLLQRSSGELQLALHLAGHPNSSFDFQRPDNPDQRGLLPPPDDQPEPVADQTSAAPRRGVPGRLDLRL